LTCPQIADWIVRLKSQVGVIFWRCLGIAVVVEKLARQPKPGAGEASVALERLLKAGDDGL